MTRLRVPIICTVIGEGGSGGALAIAVGDQLEHAAILHVFGDFAGRLRPFCGRAPKKPPRPPSPGHHRQPALKTLGLIDKVINEPLGGAQRDHAAMMQSP